MGDYGCLLEVAQGATKNTLDIASSTDLNLDISDTGVFFLVHFPIIAFDALAPW